MQEAILDFHKQFSFQPELKQAGNFYPQSKFVVCGMGGSHLAADILKSVKLELPLFIHKNYGLPLLSEEELSASTIVISSYSGNTEEVVDGFHQAIEQGYQVVVITTGGQLLDLAKRHKVPYIQLPQVGIQPRMALGYSFKALLKIIGDENLWKEAEELALWLNPADYESYGSYLQEKLIGKVPIIYASERNQAIAYNWKIKLNETGKIPAFYNIFPELNHNEMTGFDVRESSRSLADNFFFIIIKDRDDLPQIRKRMDILERLYLDRNLPIEVLELIGDNHLQKIFSSLLIADWLALKTAKYYGLEPEQVPMVEEFKEKMRKAELE